MYNVPSKEVYYTILHHDVPEIITGDIPFLAKKYFPDLAYVIKTKEFDAEDMLKIQFPDLDPIEKKQIKNADLVEMLLFAVNDVNMGCQYSIDVIENILEALGDDKTVKDYLSRNGYQRAINRILAYREEENTRPIP